LLKRNHKFLLRGGSLPSLSATIEEEHLGVSPMVEQVINIMLPSKIPSGMIVAANVSEADYLQYYAESFHEWVNGFVIKHPIVSHQHQELKFFLRTFLDCYFELLSSGETIGAPFLLKLPKTYREPDIQVILHTNTDILTEYFTDGSADICIEIVSSANEGADYGDKLQEYEDGGVREYWIIDPQRQECRFHRLNKAGVYKLIATDEDIYTTPLLPDFKLDTRVFWRLSLPSLIETVELVKSMLEKAE
jgi:Uma2 family endonuclease